MKQKWTFFLILSMTLFCFYFFWDRDKTEDINLSERTLTEPQKLSSTAPATQEPEYKRQAMERPLLKSDLKFFSNPNASEDELLSQLRKIKNRKKSVQSDFDFSETKEWNLAQLPSNQEEYLNYFEEIQIKALVKFSEEAVAENLQAARTYYGGYVAAEIMKKLEFRGYDDEQQFVLRIPEDGIAAHQKKRENDYAKIKSKILNKKRKPANESEKKEIDKAFSYAALFKERIEQAIYYADFENPDKISDRYWVGKKTLFESLTGAIDFLVTSLSNADIFYSSKTKTHTNNMDLINKTLNDAHKNPEEYKLEGQGPFDAASMDFEVISEPLIRQVSLHHAFLGAGLSTLMGKSFIDHVQKARIFAAGLLVTIGVESLISALGCYWGNVRLIFLHRYHTYLKRAKEFHKQIGKDFIISRIPKFNPEKVYLSEATRIELNKSWLWGFSFGSFFNRLAVQPALRNGGSRIALWAIDNLASERVITQGLAKGAWWITEFMTTNIAESMVRILAFPFKAFSWAGKLIDFVKSAVRVSPGAIAAYIVDFSVTTLAVYATIQTKLHASTIMLNRLYYAPEMAIYLAHQSQWHEKEPFVEASRRLFYPLCHFFATTDLNAQKMTSFDDTEDSDIKKIFRKQTENCLTIIAAYEDVELNSVSTRFESLLNEGKIDKETYDAYFEKKSISKKKIVDIITEVHKFYPDFYRILWVSGLKSVYTIDSLPTGFYGFKNLLIYGEGFEENDNYYSYLSTSIGKQGEEENVLQFEWTIEKLAYRAKDLKIEAGRGTKDDPLNLTEAYSIFWRHHSKKQKEFSEEALKLLKKDKKSWLGHVWNGFVAAKENLQWVFYRLFSDPYKLTFRYEVEQNLKSIPVN